MDGASSRGSAAGTAGAGPDGSGADCCTTAGWQAAGDLAETDSTGRLCGGSGGAGGLATAP
eukprot:2535850-Alexandrium_andersonii.AAC.1